MQAASETAGAAGPGPVVTVAAMDWMCVLDLASLRLSRSADARVAVARSSAGETLARIDVDPDLDARDVAFALYEAVLAGAVVTRTAADGSAVTCPVALYNPYSGQLAVEALPRSRVYDLGERTFDVAGWLVRTKADRISVEGELLAPIVSTPVSVATACGAHPDAE